MHPAGFTLRSFAPGRIAVFGGLALLIGACGAPAATSTPTVAAPTPTLAATASLSPTVAVTVEPLITPSPVPTPTATAVPATVPPPTAQPLPGVTGLYGTPVLIGDQQFVSVLAFEQTTIVGTKPRTGKVFVSVSIRIDAIKTTSFDSADFTLRDPAGKSYTWRTGRSPHLYDLANLEPGHNYVGWITYEVPKASIAALVLVYKPRFLVGVWFEIPLS